MKKEKMLFYTIIVVMILIFAIFFGVVQFQLKSITEKEEDELSLEATIIADKSSGTSPLKVNFKPLILNEVGEVRFTWDFGNGITSNEESPTYTYIEEGEYDCKLIVEDDNSKQKDSYKVIVLPNNPPEVKIVCDTTAFRPATIDFDAEVFDPEGENLIYNWNLKYPPFFGFENNETINQKSFSKKFWRNGNYVAELTVTDESGNSATDYEIIQVQKSQIEIMYSTLNFIILIKSPAIINSIWKFFEDPFTNYLDDHWLEWPSGIQNLILKVIGFANINYEPPIPKADLVISEIDVFNHSASVNSSGGVPTEVSISNSILIKNNDILNVAKNVYLTLIDPLSDEKGLIDEIEREELTVSIDAGKVSKQLFYNGEYKNYEDCVLIDNLAYGDTFTGEITVTLNSADIGTFKDNEIYSCNLYVYQEKADFVEAIPFEIIT